MRVRCNDFVVVGGDDDRMGLDYCLDEADAIAGCDIHWDHLDRDSG